MSDEQFQAIADTDPHDLTGLTDAELGIMFKTLPQPVGSGARKLQALMA